MEDLNTPEFLHKVKRTIYEQLRDLPSAPGVQMQGEHSITYSLNVRETDHLFLQTFRGWVMMTMTTSSRRLIEPIPTSGSQVCRLRDQGHSCRS